jgi:hypothetical protein
MWSKLSHSSILLTNVKWSRFEFQNWVTCASDRPTHGTDRSQDDASWEEIRAPDPHFNQSPFASAVVLLPSINVVWINFVCERGFYNNAFRNVGGRGSHLIGTILPVCGRCDIRMQWQPDIWPTSALHSASRSSLQLWISPPFASSSSSSSGWYKLFHNSSESWLIDHALFWYCRSLEDLLKIEVCAEYVDCRFPVETECIRIYWVSRSASLRYAGLMLRGHSSKSDTRIRMVTK